MGDDGEGLARYLRDVPHVTSADELCDLLCDTVGVDPELAGAVDPRYVRPIGGLTLVPRDLAACLWGLRDTLRALGTKTFLHVGTHHGYAFFVVLAFLRAHVDMDLVAHTIDDRNYVFSDVSPLIRRCRAFASPAALAGRHYDLVLIRRSSPDAYDHVGPPATVCIVEGPARGEGWAAYGTLSAGVQTTAGAQKKPGA